MTTATATITHTAALARLGHALADPTRTSILLALREAPAYPSDLADALGVSRQVMSNQLACLRGCGLVESIPDGRRTWYRLAHPQLAVGARRSPAPRAVRRSGLLRGGGVHLLMSTTAALADVRVRPCIGASA
jgi:DNA-binding transcriptional ArsR family regulator